MLCELIVVMVLTMKIRTYSELKRIESFVDRFNYLKLGGTVGIDTFGFDRYLNQVFYNCLEWKQIRDFVILRDNGCDLGVAGHEIPKFIIIHHMNPISIEDVKNRNPIIFDPEFLITTVLRTHNAIHYGTDDSIFKVPLDRKSNDTIPWR